MSFEFRSTSPDDAAAVSAFLRKIFGMTPQNPTIEPRHMRWKYWEDWSDWPGSRGYILTKDGDIVAHGAVVPLTCRWGDRQIKVVRVIDWSADAQTVGAGVNLMKRIGRMADAVMAVGGTEMTLRIFPALGAKQFGMVHLYARPLRPFRRIAAENRVDWRVGARVARSLLWSLKAPSTVPDGWVARRITPDELSLVFPRPRPTPGAAVFERSTASLSYYLRCPSVPFELYSVEKDQKPRGYFLLATVGHQVRIADSWLDSTGAEEWRALHLLTVQQAYGHADAVEVVTMSSDGVTRHSLESCGFHHRGSLEVQLFDSSKRGLPEGDLRVQMMEGDSSYLNDGSGTLWG